MPCSTSFLQLVRDLHQFCLPFLFDPQALFLGSVHACVFAFQYPLSSHVMSWLEQFETADVPFSILHLLHFLTAPFLQRAKMNLARALFVLQRGV
jgi:hypothetical protein